MYCPHYPFNVPQLRGLELIVGLKRTFWRIGLGSWFKGRFDVSDRERVLNEPMGRDINLLLHVPATSPRVKKSTSPFSISCEAEDRSLVSVLGDRFHQVVSNRVTVVYEIDASVDVVACLVQELETRKTDFEIADWGISQATLDDVFIRLCGDAGHEG